MRRFWIKIMRRLFDMLTISAALFFAALILLAIPSFFDPEFEIINNASETVSVTAMWRESEKQIGPLSPNTSHRFSVDDEGGIRFRVHYANGQSVETEPRYFSRGFKMSVTITNGGVDVRHEWEQPER